MSKRHSLFIFAGLGLLSLNAWAEVETNREIVRTLSNFHLHQRDFPSAKAILDEHLKADAKDAEAWNLLGLTLMKMKDYSKAENAFRQAFQVASNELKGISAYHLADAYARANDVNKAKQTLAIAMKYENTASAAESATSEVRAGQALPELELPSPGHWSGTFAASTGYDTNVILTPDLLAGAATGTTSASPFMTILGQAANSQSVGGANLATHLTAAYSHQIAQEAQKYNSLYGQAGADWMLDARKAGSLASSMYAQLDSSLIGSFNFYNATGTAGWKGNLDFDSRSGLEFAVPVQYQLFARQENEAAVDGRSGIGTSPRLTHRFGLWRGVLNWSLKAGLHQASGDNYKTYSAQLPVAWSVPLFMQFNATLGASAARVWYPKAVTARTDTNFDVNFALSRAFYRQWNGTMTYGYRKNDSLNPLADYQKHVLTMMVSYAFL